MWDDEERQYLDLTSGGGTMLLGHNHPRVTEAITNQLAPSAAFRQASTTTSGRSCSKR